VTPEKLSKLIMEWKGVKDERGFYDGLFPLGFTQANAIMHGTLYLYNLPQVEI
jgi:hypothetical protein